MSKSSYQDSFHQAVGIKYNNFLLDFILNLRLKIKYLLKCRMYAVLVDLGLTVTLKIYELI